MSKVLFVDACARGWEVSRTYAVAEAFMNAYREQHPRDEIEELTLAGLGLAYFTGKELEYRDALLARGGQADDYFKLARQFAAADKIVLAAPLWDLSFPALLKVYIENVSVENITFGCGEAGCYGICQARRMVFLTTRGSAYEGSHLEMGSRYLQAMAEFFGIDRYDCVAADGLDAMGANPESILRAACAQAAELAKTF